MVLNIDLVVKFGGSSITDKDKLETLNPAALKCAAELIKRCYDQKLKCVVVHGAGSFGHHQAKQYNVNGGWTKFGEDLTSREYVQKGMCLTRLSCTKLLHHVTEALNTEQVPAIGVSVCGTWQTESGHLTQCDMTPIETLLKDGFVPVLHGDCVLDSSKGCSILSGDTIIKTICNKCTVERVVFLTNVDGVYDTPPQDNPDAKLQTRLLVNKDKTIVQTSEQESCHIESNCNEHDVTGGMTLKLTTAVDIVSDSDGRIPVFVCRIDSLYAQNACLHGLDGIDLYIEKGTVIVGHT